MIIFQYSIFIESKSITNIKLTSRINYLLNLTKAEEQFNNILNEYITNDPNLSFIKIEMQTFVKKFFSYEILRPHIVQVYSQLFTLTDINGLIKFYSSSLGKKLIEKENQAKIHLTTIIKKQLEKQMPEILSWFQEVLSRDYSKNTFSSLFI